MSFYYEENNFPIRTLIVRPVINTIISWAGLNELASMHKLVTLCKVVLPEYSYMQFRQNFNQLTFDVLSNFDKMRQIHQMHIPLIILTLNFSVFF